MVIFEDIQDVEEWLTPLRYVAFWEAVAPYEIFPEGERERCDDLIASDEVGQALILECLKGMARIALTERFGLRHRVIEPVDAQYLSSTH